ncbi:hypothetical protein GCM10008924_00020 [Gracilibacillus halotolerans]
MPNFILTLKLNTQPFEESNLNKRLNIGRQIYNACLNELNKRYRTLQQSKEYKKAYKMTKDKERNKLFNSLNKKYGLTEYSLHGFIKPMQHHFKKNIDSFTAQKIATRCFKAFQKLMFHEADKVKFKRFGEMNSLEGKSNKTGIRFTDNKLKWNGLTVSVVIKRNDVYAQTAIENNKIKYCRIVRKLVRGKNKFYIQLVMEGVPPTKYNKETGEVKHSISEGKVGIDIGTQTIAIASNKEAKLLELAPSINNMEREKRILQHKLDRQRRASNPHKYNEDGTIKKGNKNKWIFSNRYIQTRNALAEMQRKIADKRKQDHEKLANYILSLGNDIKVESMNYKGLQARAKETTVNEKTGKHNKKKRFGKSISNKAPSMLLTILDNKLKFQDTELKKINTYSVKASQYNHMTNKYSKKELGQRWNDFGEFKIQRDLYSAFLIMNVNEDLKTINRESCFSKFNNFKELHDLEIDKIKSCENKLISSMGI